MLCSNTPVNVIKLNFGKGEFSYERKCEKSHKRLGKNEKNKGRECKQKINQIEGFTVRVRFLDTGLCLMNLIDAYIKEKLLN